MPQYVITPWKHPSELLQVRREIYQLGEAAHPTDLRRHAVDWIAAWKMRGNLPHAVESTALLVDAILHHDATINSTFSIRATYSAAFCRFVTGFCDIEQNAAHKRSMYDVARVIEMPASFVELRHEATHDELPSIPRLMRNTRLALDWLWQYYWAKLEDDAPVTERPVTSEVTPSTRAVRAVLSAFLSRRRGEIKSSAESTSQESASGMAALEIIKLCMGEKKSLGVVASTVLEMLVPAGRTIGSSMEGAFVIWGNLLRRLTLHQKHFLRVLLDCMVHRITQYSPHLDLKLDTFREAMYEWVMHIFSAKEWVHPAIRNRVQDQRDLVVGECIEEPPNCWSTPLARRLVEDGQQEFKEQWLPLLEIMSSEI